jgi:hypothetical protein
LITVSDILDHNWLARNKIKYRLSVTWHGMYCTCLFTNMNIHSNEDVFGMAVIFGTTGTPPHFLCDGFWMLKLNENWVTIEPELGDN